MEEVGGWVGGLGVYRKMEENGAVRMSYCELGVGWVEENKAVGMS